MDADLAGTDGVAGTSHSAVMMGRADTMYRGRMARRRMGRYRSYPQKDHRAVHGQARWNGIQRSRTSCHLLRSLLLLLTQSLLQVGDLPTRFHYAPVMPDNFGLAAEEILLATDAELNDYAGLRRLAAYRKGKKKR